MSTKKLFDILPKQGVAKIVGDPYVLIKDLHLDSREVVGGGAFFARKGWVTDGHRFTDKAIEGGAIAIFTEYDIPQTHLSGVTYVYYQNANRFLGELAHRFFGLPSNRIKLIGVTGTNGKSSTVTLLYHMFMTLGVKAGLLSTIENRIGDYVLPSKYTTPDAISLNRLLSQMVNEGCEYVFMEVSSHAIDQGRIAGLNFTGGVFTNITHDHLDYHPTFREYLEVKKSFFDDLPEEAFALSNVDDKNGKVMLQNTRARKFYYGLHTFCDYKSRILENTIDGLLLEINSQQVHCNLSGAFNASNLSAVYGVGHLSGFKEEDILLNMSMLRGVEGRFDKVMDTDKGMIGIVDYAHTPDALEKVLDTIREVLTPGRRVIAVIGCGGDRDKAKRPLMTKIALEYADWVVITSDNPRSENPDSILDDMVVGLSFEDLGKLIRITDRKEAIHTACALALPKDIVLVAGKGHEKYQEINGVKHPFDDKEILREYLTSG
ncbi:MAG TPA: UDP-N-acetylmuramoyl-L-alanyl-D-glutamate--2,6-diaminopimelate ligase [Saprospiraceae bacterium]|nr:UDP-N-acetylmuramoyl-L-alanyl-D-glutamate--2,6-diaminopimelate ligase [Saprospiraceae bacterium]